MAVQRTTLRLTMLLLGFPRGGIVINRLFEALARDTVVGLSAPPPASLPLNAFYLIAFRSIENIFLWKYINVCRQVGCLAHRARVISNLSNLDRVCRHVKVHHVPVQWAGGG